ncbi:hypothetical protein [Flavilitoribacter nigricans]|uniref:Uncharacterized protein n=1 Tax=Flavilitoribacter nigricans (strain ATCC 23147 / DSM 23189 / NBRC 102662 / NCIMB 1420 / SS-2) TaxID=1122177 RepID=A0A2D0MYB1_FLAN2|nr:hypothetical protein [Flavilitoribacter nigricans]PHN01272.1 hypothetical protein CRP01_37980 [Flavilitoribacter nigricans DSM 23189 = NBRC 102662]
MKKRTIKEEARYFLQCRGYEATEQEIQRAIWRERKHSRAINGWCIYSYLMHNNIAKPVGQSAIAASDQSIS